MARRPAAAPAPRRQPRQERSRERVDRILDATAAMIDARGLDAVTTNAIAEAAAVPVGTIYQFFPNREAVLQALLQRQLEQLDSRFLMLIIERSDASPIADAVAQVVEALARAYLEIPALATLVQTLRADPRFAALAEANNRTVANYVADLAARRAPRLTAARRDAIATAAVAAADAVLMAWLRALRADRPTEARALLLELRALLTAYLTSVIPAKT